MLKIINTKTLMYFALHARFALMIAFVALCSLAQNTFAQVIYGVAADNTGLFNRVFIVDPVTGASSAPAVANTISPNITESAALAVSPLNGLVYLVERETTRPRIVTWNPQTGAVTTVGTAGTPSSVGQFLRATFCPDGRFYIAGNGSAGGAGAEIYQIDPSNANLIRTLVITNLPTSGSGDIVCTSNGDLYAVAQSTVAPLPYAMYRLTAAQIAAAPPTGSTPLVAGFIGNSNIANTQAFNGLSESPNGQIIASVAFNQTAIYSVTTSTFVATTLTTTDPRAFADLSRGFPLGISVSKSQTPTSMLQGTQTVTYTVNVTNAGPAVAGNVSVIDTLPAAFQTVTWVCGPTNSGLTTTVVTTACAAGSGSGNLNTTASLSIGGAVRYTITAILSSTFTGTLTNVANGTVSTLLTVVTPSATISTVTATVAPAANLAVTKNDGTSTVVAGTTINYTITFSNFGPGAANQAVIQDTPGPGLQNCTVVSCTGAGTPTAATCPATPTLLISPGTTSIPSFPANSSVTVVVRCGVSATGL
jgi:uncharacterized repeat protein (TIGR01451 family)